MLMYIIRHGQTDWNKEGRLQGCLDIPLNDVGREQAASSGDALREAGIELIITSTLMRAVETGEIIRDIIGDVPMLQDELLLERDFGVMNGAVVDEREAENWPETFGVEPIERVSERMWTAMEKFREHYKNKRILVVTHGTALHSLLGRLKGDQFELGPADIKNTGVSCIEYSEKPKLVWYNLVGEDCKEHIRSQDPNAARKNTKKTAGKNAGGKKKSNWAQILMMLFFGLIGAACGILIMKNIDRQIEAGASTGQVVVQALALFVGMYIAIFLQIVIHEAGHLVFGLLTGYRFSSFRVGSLMWRKEDGRLRLCRLSLAGTGGQCLMDPPEWTEENYPYVLYNLGGSIMNLCVSVLCVLLYFISRGIPVLGTFWLIMAAVGTAFALMNGLPLRLGTVDNDGYNVLSMRRDPEAVHAFWLQLKYTERIAAGVRLKDMPEEWFVMPSAQSMKNSMIAVVGAVICNRLTDAMDFEAAQSALDEFLNAETGITDLNRRILLLDRECIKLLLGKEADAGVFTDKEQVRFMRAMHNYPSILRAKYIYALLGEHDADKALKVLLEFEKIAGRHPYPAEIEGERELIAFAQELAPQEEAVEEITEEIEE